MQEEWGKWSPNYFLEFGQFDFLNLVPDLALFNLSVKIIAKRASAHVKKMSESCVDFKLEALRQIYGSDDGKLIIINDENITKVCWHIVSEESVLLLQNIY